MSAQEPRQPEPEQHHRAPRPASSHPNIAARLAWLEAHWPNIPQAPAMPKRLLRTVDAFGDRPENRDGRGLSVTARETVLRTLKHVRSAVRKSDGRGDLAHAARRFLKSLAHITEFDETIERARRFRGEVQKTGCRRAKATPVCEAQAYVCGVVSGVGEIRLRRERSVAELQKVGRALHLCVAHANELGRTYHNALKTGESEFWSLRTAAGPFALLSVRVEEGERCIEEFEGGNEQRPVVTDANGRRHALSGVLLRNVLRKLKADPSNIDHFTCVGRFRACCRGGIVRTIATCSRMGATSGSGASPTKSSSRCRRVVPGRRCRGVSRSGHGSYDVNGGASIGDGDGNRKFGDSPSGSRALGTARRWISASCLSC